MAHSTTSKKPEKPYKDFPLFPHDTKRWAKKIKGRFHYFGPWDDWRGALERYQYQVHYLQQGKTPPPQNVDALNIDTLVNKFLERKEQLVETGRMSDRTFKDYKPTANRLVKVFGRYTTVESLTPDDFDRLYKELSKTLKLVALAREITRVRAIFNYAHKNRKIPNPVNWGDSFAPISKRELRIDRNKKPAKIFTLEELTAIYHAADAQMKTFILLGLNCGLGNSDIGLMELRHIDNGWLKYPRPKTACDRLCPLWRETIDAINHNRQTSDPTSPYLFLTKYGNCWSKDIADNPLSKEFAKLCKACGLHQKGRGFYSLRHQFRTVADGIYDRVAIDLIMGHADDSMGGNYREWVDPKRLQAVVDHVYKWIKPMFRKPAKKKGGAK